MAQAYFGKPSKTFVPGGAHVAVYVVPVFEGRLVVFDVAARAARGRWLPWDVLEFGGNPYETAAALADDWCEGAVSDLALADVMYMAKDLIGMYYDTYESLFLLIVAYLVILLPISLFGTWLERRFDYERR